MGNHEYARVLFIFNKTANIWQLTFPNMFHKMKVHSKIILESVDINVMEEGFFTL